MKVLVFPNRSPNNSYFEEFNRILRTAGIQDIRLATVLRFRSNFDVMHFHFPDQVITQGDLLKSFTVTLAVLCLMFYAKATKRPIVWMVHDVSPLWIRRRRVLLIFMRVFKSFTDGYIFLSDSSQKAFYQSNPNERSKSSALIHITRYKTYEFDKNIVEGIREKSHVGKDGILISILGDIKPHKGSDCIPLIPNQTSSGIKVSLAVCGQVDSMKEEAITKLLRDRPQYNYIRLNKRLQDDELALWIQASDVVLLPYMAGYNSSMAINVFSNGSRIISSDIPIFRELSHRFGDSWIRTVDVGNRTMIEGAINNIPDWKAQPRDLNRLENTLREGDPELTGKRLFKFYNDLCLSSAERKFDTNAGD